jgi:hypothetical protein
VQREIVPVVSVILAVVACGGRTQGSLRSLAEGGDAQGLDSGESDGGGTDACRQPHCELVSGDWVCDCGGGTYAACSSVAPGGASEAQPCDVAFTGQCAECFEGIVAVCRCQMNVPDAPDGGAAWSCVDDFVCPFP